MITQLPPVDPEELSNLYAMLEYINFPKEKYENRKGFGDNSRCMVFGIRRARRTQEIGLSAATLKHPYVWDELQRIGRLLNFPFTSIHLNKNVVCDWHTDKGNIGNTVILSLGDYEGCNLQLKNLGEFNTNCSPILFDGKLIEHRTTPLQSGTKYSIVFYTHVCALFSPNT